MGISEVYYSGGLDLSSVAVYTGATLAELDAVIKLSDLDEELISRLSESNPPKTAWTLLASASEDEIRRMLDEANNDNEEIDYSDTMSLRTRLVKVALPTIQDKVAALSGSVIEAMYNKGIAYTALNNWQEKFLKDISKRRKLGKNLSNLQVEKLAETLMSLVNDGVITRDCVDNDAEQCNLVLDALGR